MNNKKICYFNISRNFKNKLDSLAIMIFKHFSLSLHNIKILLFKINKKSKFIKQKLLIIKEKILYYPIKLILKHHKYKDLMIN